MKIQMVDLSSQTARIRDEIDTAINEVVNSCQFINGSWVNRFSDNLKQFTGSEYVITCANGTDALQIAMMALDLQPGDEVIVPVHTYVATAEAIALLKLKPLFVDVYEDLFTIDIEATRKAVTNKTKAMVPVHLYGQCADMESLMRLADEFGLHIIEDTAQAIGSFYRFRNGDEKQAGTIGTIGTTSFFPSKNLGCFGDGGAMFTHDEAIGKRLKMMANHGQRVKYYHDDIGCNSRLDSIQAAVLDVKLKYLNDYNKARKSAADYYTERLSYHPLIMTPVEAPYSTHVYHQYTLRLKQVDRDKVKAALEEKGIPSMIYYPVPLHLQRAYRDSNFGEGSYPVSEQLSKEVLSLPIHTEIDTTQQDYIVTQLVEIVDRLS